MAKKDSSVDEEVKEIKTDNPVTPNNPVTPKTSENPGATPSISGQTASQVIPNKIGLANRKPYSITVKLKKDSFIMAAGAKTGKEFSSSDIKSVNGMSLQQAVLSGVCTIIR